MPVCQLLAAEVHNLTKELLKSFLSKFVSKWPWPMACCCPDIALLKVSWIKCKCDPNPQICKKTRGDLNLVMTWGPVLKYESFHEDTTLARS